jgi:DNA-binding NtrC family response regulator
MSKEKILIIEYNLEQANKFRGILENKYEIITTDEGSNALSILEDSKNSIKVCLLHLEVTDIYGIKLVEKIRALNSKIKTITYTINDEIDACVGAMKAGAYHYFNLENFDASGFSVTIEKAIEEYGLIQEIEKMSGRQLLKEHPEKYRLDAIREYILQKSLEGVDVDTVELFELIYTENVNNEVYPGLSNDLKKVFASENTSRKPVILVIEDDEKILESYKKIFKRKSDSYYANCAAEGLKLASELEEVDIILLDIMMPDKNGDEIFPELQAFQPKAEILVVTAFKITEIASKLLRQGACGYLNKPFHYHTLDFAITKALKAKKWKKILVELNQKPTEENPFPCKARVECFEKYYFKSLEEKKEVTYHQLYYFFPALEGAMPDDDSLPSDIKIGEMLAWLGTNVAPNRDL